MLTYQVFDRISAKIIEKCHDNEQWRGCKVRFHFNPAGIHPHRSLTVSLDPQKSKYSAQNLILYYYTKTGEKYTRIVLTEIRDPK